MTSGETASLGLFTLGVAAAARLLNLVPGIGVAVAGHVEELLPVGTSVYARIGPWLAHLTLAAVAELNLAAGMPVWLVAKTHGWRVVAG